MTEMTREDIIRMAREAGGVDIESNGYTSWVGTQTTEFLERFAALIATAAKEEEREACAKVCELMIVETLDDNEWVDATNDSKQRCANVIRARSTK